MSIHKRKTGGLATLLTLCVLLLSGSQAHAGLGNFTLEGGINGLSFIEGLAVDESTGDVYAYFAANGEILKFDAAGNPVNFSGLGTNKIAGVGSVGGNEAELAVDNSTGPAKGDIYIGGPFGVEIYGVDGKKLGELTQVGGVPWGEEVCGVATDGAGNVYVGLYPSNVNKYTPTANPVTNGGYVSTLAGVNEVCNISADPEGSVYVSTWTFNRKGPIVKYDASQFGQSVAVGKLVTTEANGALSAANSPSAELFVGHNNELVQYGVSGNQTNSFGASTGVGYRAVAINAKSATLYAFTNGEIQIWRGAIVPAVQTGQATGLTPAGSATLNGSINPEGTSIEGCAFQYGLSVSYGSENACAQATPLTGSIPLAVSAGVSSLVPNHTYHYRLAATDKNGTIYGTDQHFIILIGPTVEDAVPSATAITRETAKLNGTIDPEQTESAYYFEYGLTESYTNITPEANTGSGVGDTAVSQQLIELLPETTYHYRLVARNVAGTTIGIDHTFTTGSPTPPVAVTGGASGVTQNTATIAGTVDTNGLPTSYGFEIGTSTDYGPPTGLGTVGAGASKAPVSLPLTGLVPGTTYHYRLMATNLDGTSHGADQTFTTGVFANTFAEPPAPLPFVSVPAIVFPNDAGSGVAKTKHKKTKKHVKHRSKTKRKKKK
jgi:hypothetical protein